MSVTQQMNVFRQPPFVLYIRLQGKATRISITTKGTKKNKEEIGRRFAQMSTEKKGTENKKLNSSQSTVDSQWSTDKSDKILDAGYWTVDLRNLL